MAKFVVVKEAPTEVKNSELVIEKPLFMAEIESQRRKAGRGGLTGANHLRAILDVIAQNYDPDRMNMYSCRVSNYEGRPYSTDEELNTIVNEMLRADYPAVFAKYLEKKIRTRPKDTQLIYYVDSDIDSARELFIQNGLDELVEEIVEKPKRSVGKPAITKEQAESLSKVLNADSDLEKNSVLKY